MKNRFKIVMVLLFGFAISSSAQSKLKIGDNQGVMASGAVLDVESTTGGILLPRMTANLIDAIVSPAAGLLIWCSDCDAKGEMEVFNGDLWTLITGASASSVIATVSSTTAVSGITYDSAISGGTVSSIGRSLTSSRGICWGTSAGPTVLDSKNVASGTTGIFSSELTGLSAGTVYYVRAYTTNIIGTAYGNEVSFTTAASTQAVVATTAVSNITKSTATSGGTVSSDGGSAITARGICWGTTTSPTVLGSQNVASGTTGSFSSELTGLFAGTIYYVRSFATNDVGTSYGNELSFTTVVDAPAVASTTAVSAITISSAASGGTVSNDGGSTITARGICWGTTTSPTVSGSQNVVTGTTGSFSSELTGLSAGTIYYVRSFATNGVGTSYGNELSFTTAVIAPTIASTTAVSSITYNSATSGGTVSSDGGSTITARGICWATTATPTISGSKTVVSGTTGSFSSGLTGLSAGTLYYVRAYATNSAGTSYGNTVNFTTNVANPPSGGYALTDGSRPTTVVEVTGRAGKIWMDRNLGASRAGTSATDYYAYGGLYQWGRGNDGHASISWTSSTGGNPVYGSTTNQSTTNSPGHNLFIRGSSDWRSSQNNALWYGVTAVNNPCPSGFRLPTSTEWDNEVSGLTNTALAYNSALKLVMSGNRFNAALGSTGGDASYWSSSVNGSYAYYRYFNSGSANGAFNSRSVGYSVRCIKD